MRSASRLPRFLFTPFLMAVNPPAVRYLSPLLTIEMPLNLATNTLSSLIEADIFARKTGPEPFFTLACNNICVYAKKITLCALFFRQKKARHKGRAIQGEVLKIQLIATQYSPVGDNPVVLLVQSRPVQQFDMLCFHLKILRKQSLNFRYLQNLIVPLIQFDHTAVLISDVLLIGSQQKSCVILGTHDPRVRIRDQ